MKFSKKIITDATVVLGGLAIGVTMSGCAGLTGANGNVCNNNNQCVSFSEHPGSPSGSPASASTYPTPTPQSESASASIPGAAPSPTISASVAATLTPPPTPTEAVPTSTTIPQEQFDSSLHRCKQASAVNTLLSVNVDDQLFACMQIPPDQTDLLIKLIAWAVYDALTGQPFNPPAQYQGTVPAQQAQDVVAAYQGHS